MNKKKVWINLLLVVIVLVLIILNMLNFSNDSIVQPINAPIPTYQSKNLITMVYNPSGKLIYKLKAKDMKYFIQDEVGWFSQPIMTFFDKNALETWLLRADRAKIMQNSILYLYGHVELNCVSATSQLKKITTDHVKMNLITQEISSDKGMTFYGRNFISNGMRMRGNLKNQTAELIDEVKTKYEINKKTITL